MNVKLKSTGQRVWIAGKMSDGRYEVFFPYGFKAKSGKRGEFRIVNSGALNFDIEKETFGKP